MNKKEIEQLLEIVKKSAEKIDQSTVFLSLFTDSYAKDPLVLMQLALALLLDKPLFFLVPHGVRLPPRLEQIADLVERYDPEDVKSAQEAVKAILTKSMRH